MDVRIPPHSIEAEQSVLGCLMLVPASINKIRLAAEDFYLRDHRTIFEAIKACVDAGEAPDAITVGEWLERHDGEHVAPKVIALATQTGTAENLPAYARIVADKAQARRLIDFAHELAGEAFTTAEPGEVLERATRDLLTFTKPAQKHSISIKDAIRSAYMEIEKAIERKASGKLVGVTTGLQKLDSFTGGWQKQDLVVVGARPSVGKTALMCGFAVAAKVPVGFISAEQGAAQIAMRHMAQVARVPLHDMRNGTMLEEAYAKFSSPAFTDFAQSKYWIWDRPAPTIDEVVAQARQWKQEHGIKLLLVDYIQRLSAPGYQSKAYEINHICQRLKETARDLDIPVIALSQVGRHVDAKGPDYVPFMGDLSDSSGIEKEADMVIILHRPDVSDSEHKDAGTATIAIRKHRSGETGHTRVAFVDKYVSFEDLSQFESQRYAS